MKLISECLKSEVSSKVCKEEEGKQICFEHGDYEFICDVVPIEKCVFKNVQGGKRCDYLFLFDRNKQQYKFLGSSLAYYVELKGTGLAEACEQLLNSIDLTMSQIIEFDLNALVISSRAFVPKYDNNEYYRAVKRLIRRNIQFEVTPYTVTL